jgi:prepilin-type N-terminal cleavage/methylation domain-containing protein
MYQPKPEKEKTNIDLERRTALFLYKVVPGKNKKKRRFPKEMKIQKPKKAFTIVELVIVIAVIAILMGIMFVGGTALNSNAKTAALDSDFRNFEVNLKAAIQSTEGNEKILFYQSYDGADAAAKKANQLAALNEVLAAYLEDDYKITLVAEDTNGYTDEAAYPKYCADTTATDPWGQKYHVEVVDRSTVGETNITIYVKSNGKNQLTSKQGFDKDDQCLVIAIVNSTVQTKTIDKGYESVGKSENCKYSDVKYDAASNKWSF